MASEMIERVARAQAGARWDQFDDEHKNAARDLARIAIEAMREPTTEMVLAAFDGPTYACAHEYEISDGWRLMIDTALAEPLPVKGSTTE